MRRFWSTGRLFFVEMLRFHHIGLLFSKADILKPQKLGLAFYDLRFEGMAGRLRAGRGAAGRGPQGCRQVAASGASRIFRRVGSRVLHRYRCRRIRRRADRLHLHSGFGKPARGSVAAPLR